MCQNLHCLPRSGGLYNQDPIEMFAIQFVMLAQQEKAERKAKERGSNNTRRAPRTARKRRG